MRRLCPGLRVSWSAGDIKPELVWGMRVRSVRARARGGLAAGSPCLMRRCRQPGGGCFLGSGVCVAPGGAVYKGFSPAREIRRNPLPPPLPLAALPAEAARPDPRVSAGVSARGRGAAGTGGFWRVQEGPGLRLSASAKEDGWRPASNLPTSTPKRAKRVFSTLIRSA